MHAWVCRCRDCLHRRNLSPNIPSCGCSGGLFLPEEHDPPFLHQHLTVRNRLTLESGCLRLSGETGPERSFSDGCQCSLERIAASAADSILTTKERQVFQGILAGKTSSEIGAESCCSKRTVETHGRNVLRKCKARRVTDLFRYATATNLPDPLQSSAPTVTTEQVDFLQKYVLVRIDPTSGYLYSRTKRGMKKSCPASLL
jgi:DNA-binding CsgD family transcriptional regulator